MGTDKRERQKTARLEKIVAEQAAAKRARTKRSAVRAAVGLVVIVIALFAVTTIWGDDDDSSASDDTSSSSTTLPEPEEPTCENPAVAAAVGREVPDTEPPPEDTAPDALEITTLVEGTGADAAAAGDTLVVHYLGKTADGKIFDCSWRAEGTGEPFSVVLGQGMVIPGWDEGLIGAKAGERRHLLIGSEKAYGSTGSGSIPPDSPLAFDVDIVEVQKAGAAPPAP